MALNLLRKIPFTITEEQIGKETNIFIALA